MQINFRDFLIWFKDLLRDTAGPKTVSQRVNCVLDLSGMQRTSTFGFYLESEFISSTMVEIPVLMIDDDEIKARVAYRLSLAN